MSEDKRFRSVLDIIDSNSALIGRCNELQQENSRLRLALETTMGQCRYWLKTYRSHTGFMNATHLSEQESLTKAIAIAEKALEGES